jgi:hypothetical protein
MILLTMSEGQRQDGDPRSHIGIPRLSLDEKCYTGGTRCDSFSGLRTA